MAIRRSKDKGGGQGGQGGRGGQEAKAAVKADGAVKAVEAVLEMWRVDDEWWRQPISRRYFEVMLEGGARVVLFEDLTNGEWFIQTP